MDLILTPRAVEQPPMFLIPSDELTVVIASLSIGGAEQIVLDWASRIDPKWKVHLVVLRNRKEEWPVPASVRVTRLEDSERLREFHSFSNLHERRLEQLRLIGEELAKSSNPVCVCHLLAKDERDALIAHGALVVTVLHNAKDGWPEEASLLSGSLRTVAVSDACARDLKESGWRGPISTVRHIPSRPVFQPRAREIFRRAWNIPEDATVIGMIGAVKPQKNYHLALSVLKALHEKKDAYLVILGGPLKCPGGREYWESVVKAVRDMGLRNRVAMPGFITYATRCLPAFDLVLNTSNFEGLSIATLEALQGGKRVIARKVGGQGEVSCGGLTLISEDAHNSDWVAAILNGLGSKFDVPAWTDFPAYRLWTLMSLARPVRDAGKVLFVTANLNSGGAQRSLVNLAKALNGKLPLAIAVAGNSTSSYFYRELKHARVEVSRSADSWDAFSNAEALVQKICAENIGTVCFWNLDSKVKLLLVKALDSFGVRFVDVSPGDNSFDEMGALTKFQEFISFSREEFYARLDTLVMKYHGEAPIACVGKTKVIPNGVPQPAKMKTSYNLSGAPRVVVSGRIAPTKFLLEIIEAMRLVREKIPAAELHIFGAAEIYAEEYAQKVFEAAKAATNSKIFFHGSNFEVATRLPEFDVYVVLGKDQGCPNALLEALAAGMPVVANDNGGTREQVIHGSTGFLIPDTDPQHLAEAIVALLTNRELARRLGQAGKEHASLEFSMERMSEQYLRLFTGATCVQGMVREELDLAHSTSTRTQPLALEGSMA